MLAPAAADSVLELDNVVHWLIVFAFSLFGKFLLLFFRFRHAAICCLQARFSLDPDGPDEAQQFASYRRHDLPLVLACGHQLHVALVQAVLCLPCNLR